MFDKFDLKYGITDKTRDKLLFSLVCVFLLFILIINSDLHSLFNLKIPANKSQLFSLISTIFLVGLVINIFLVFISILLDVNYFKKNNKRHIIRTRMLNNTQQTKLLKKIYIFKELYSIVLKPREHPYKLGQKDWKLVAKRVGKRSEAVSKMKYLHLLEMKVRDKKPLKDSEIDFLNDVLLEKKHLQLYRRIRKNSE